MAFQAPCHVKLVPLEPSMPLEPLVPFAPSAPLEPFVPFAPSTPLEPFAEWHEVFPNAACVVSLVDRLVHRAEIVALEGESYRVKEARERTEQRAKQRRGAK